MFCPVLVAIAVRIVLFFAAVILAIGGRIVGAESGYFEFCEGLGAFETFVWDQSWAYWAIVAIFTFIGEMIIWEDNN